jgi:putative component of membrane protein insertase Oxa1/YidC/SpoIIIJ protein YidD
MLFNIYINDMENCIPNELSTITCKYADDCSQYELVSIGQNSKVPEAVNFLKDWAIQNKMS